jgi:hypothetical protein
MFLVFRNRKIELSENRSFRLFAANRKRKWQTTRLLAANRNRKWKFVFLGQKTINGNRQLLFQETCPSMGNTTHDYNNNSSLTANVTSLSLVLNVWVNVLAFVPRFLYFFFWPFDSCSVLTMQLYKQKSCGTFHGLEEYLKVKFCKSKKEANSEGSQNSGISHI